MEGFKHFVSTSLNVNNSDDNPRQIQNFSTNFYTQQYSSKTLEKKELKPLRYRGFFF
jgi:hypothetical protein